MSLELVWQAVLLGVIQGLTEFLPISSSAHLLLLPWFFDWESFGITFDVLIHGGTLFAVLIYFRQDWKQLIKGLLLSIRDSRNLARQNPAAMAIAAGTLPAIVFGFLLRDVIEESFRTPLVTVVTLSGFALLLGFADRKGRGDRALETIGWKEGLLIGLAQVCALVPGVSRSGVTITAALFLGLARPAAARFSFLLAGPIIALATLDALLELLRAGEAGALRSEVAFAGIVSAFLVGFFCIKYFLRFVRTRTFVPFVVYRLVLAAIILLIVVY
jgi:undecaprenyl-diphosphatase